MAEPAAWTRLPPEMKQRIRREAADSAVRKRLRFNDAGPAFNVPGGPVEDYWESPDATRKNQRMVKQLMFKVGPLSKGEKITTETEPDGSVLFFMNSPAANSIGDIPPGTYGDEWHPGGATGDQDVPSANERMEVHTLSYPSGDPLIVKINGMNSERGNTVVGSADMPADQTIHPRIGDDLIKPVAMGSQSPPRSSTSTLSPKPTSMQINDEEDPFPNLSPKKPPSPNVNNTRDYHRYRDGSTASKLSAMNAANRRHYGQ